MHTLPLSRDARRAKPMVVPGLSPSSVAFFTAVHGCNLHGPQPHPVHVRNTDLVRAWQEWDLQKTCRLDDLLASRESCFSQNRDMLAEAMHADPACRLGQVVLPPDPRDEVAVMNRIAAPLIFWRWPHTLFELTAALEHLLVRSDLGDDIPVDLFRPPVPACFIRFGKELQQAIVPLETEQGVFARLEGVYVFESARASRRVLSMLPVYPPTRQEPVGIGMLELRIDDEQLPLVEAIRRICVGEAAGVWRHNQSVAQLCVKVFLYLRVAQAQQADDLSYTEAQAQLRRVGPKKGARLQRQIEKLYDRVVLGPTTLPVHPHGTHGEVSPHWRRGHFRMQPYGPKSGLRKVLFIAPMLVRADRL
jgi:hypothetical protein